MATTTSNVQEANRTFGSMDILTALLIGIFGAGAAFGFCYGMTMGVQAAFVGSMTGGAYATVGGTIALPFMLLVAAFARSEFTLKMTHTIGGAASSLIACLPMIGSADSPAYIVMATAFGAAIVWASLTWSIRRNDLKFDETGCGLLYRMTR